MLHRIVVLACATAGLGLVAGLTASPALAQGPPPPMDPPQIILSPPPETEPPGDAGEPPTDPEAAKVWLADIFFKMMDTNADGALSDAELHPWVLEVRMPAPPPPPPPPPLNMPGEPELAPAFPVTYWDFDEFVGELNNEVVIINFDAWPWGPTIAPMFNLDKSLAGGPLTGAEWQTLGATFMSPVGAALRTVSTIEHYPPPHMNDPMVDLFVSRPNSLTMGSAPYTPELDPADNNGVVDNNDDSLVIILNPPRAAIGFYLIDQDPGGDTPPPGEGIVYKDVNGNVIEHLQPLPAAIYPNHQFVGVVSYTAAIAQVEINESNDTDSICIDHVVLSQ
ncbi:MAG: hypothetical protein O2782_11995 [bacterium]|nr:hypothetical protein [bacterium]